MKLTLSPDLALPLDFVTSTAVILAQKGKGKTHTARALAEELMDARQQIVVIDPTDAWWGLRSSKDGKSAVYPIAVFGGDHGDVALEPGGGKLLAEAIVNERFSAIISTENLSKGAELTFLGDFLETLYRLNRQAMHLFVDEADIIAPQKPFGGEMRTCGAADDIVRRGRKKGIGCTLITQRSSVLNKNVLSQADMLIALGCSHPLDLDAIGEWVKRHADPKLARQMMESLPSLPRGQAWIWNPAAEIFKLVAIRDLRTFDSGATPKPGERAKEPKVLAPVEIARLGEAMAATAQRQKDNDPKALKAKVAELTKALEARTPKVETKVVEKSVLKEAHVKRLEVEIAKGEAFVHRLGAEVAEFRRLFELVTAPTMLHAAPPGRVCLTNSQVAAIGSPPQPSREPVFKARAPKAPRAEEDATDELSKCERLMLTTLAQHPDGLTRKQVLVFIGYSHSGTTTTAFGRLYTRGWIASQGVGVLGITGEGKRVLGSYVGLPVGDQLRHDLLHGDLSLNANALSEAEKVILKNVCEVYPLAISRTEARGHYSHSGTTTTAFSRLIRMGYLQKHPHGIVAAKELFGS